MQTYILLVVQMIASRHSGSFDIQIRVDPRLDVLVLTRRCLLHELLRHLLLLNRSFLGTRLNRVVLLH